MGVLGSGKHIGDVKTNFSALPEKLISWSHLANLTPPSGMVSNIGFDVGMTQIREGMAKLLQKYCFRNILLAGRLIYKPVCNGEVGEVG